MPSRKFHTKSRHGCANCKRRKIRCGEERPLCANCVRLGGECSFIQSDPQGGLTVIQSYETSQISEGSTTHRSNVTYDLNKLAENLHNFDDELITQYSTTTSLTMSDREDVVAVWQSTMPCLALMTPFLHHGLLSLAAMHLHHTASPEQKSLYLELATRHEDKALAEYIPKLGNITEETCHALLAFSLLLPALRYSLQLARKDEPMDAKGFIAQIISIFDFLIGATVISSNTDIWLKRGPMAAIFTLRALDNIIPQLVDGPRQALSSLMAHISHLPILEEASHETETLPGLLEENLATATTASTKATYLRSISMLSNSFSTFDRSRHYLDALIGWPYFVGPGYLHLLRSHDSLALIIFAYYGAALHDFRDTWWLDGLGARLVEAVSRAVAPIHAPLLRWPLERIASVRKV